MSSESGLTFVHKFVPVAGATVTLLMLHGTGGDENDLIPLGQRLVPAASILSPRGQVMENGMPRFFRRISEGVFDVDDLITRTYLLADFVRAAAEHYHFDTAGVVPIGFSNGANIAASMLLLEPERFPAAVLFRPMVPLIPEKSPDLTGMKIFVAAGKHDPIAPLPHTEKLVQLFENAGAKVTTNLETAGHNLTSSEILVAKKWLIDRGIS